VGISPGVADPPRHPRNGDPILRYFHACQSRMGGRSSVHFLARRMHTRVLRCNASPPRTTRLADHCPLLEPKICATTHPPTPFSGTSHQRPANPITRPLTTTTSMESFYGCWRVGRHTLLMPSGVSLSRFLTPPSFPSQTFWKGIGFWLGYAPSRYLAKVPMRLISCQPGQRTNKISQFTPTRLGVTQAQVSESKLPRLCTE